MAVSAILPFPKRLETKQGWQNQELAELYRVEHILRQAGLRVETDLGISEEGDPWFVFIREDTSDVIAHFARIDGVFIAVSLPGNESVRGSSLRDIVAQLLRRETTLAPLTATNTATLRFHPIVALTAFVTAGLLFSAKDAHAQTVTKHDVKPDDGKHVGSRAVGNTSPAASSAAISLNTAQDSATATGESDLPSLVAAALILAGQQMLSPLSDTLTLVSIAAESTEILAAGLATNGLAPATPQLLDLVQHTTPIDTASGERAAQAVVNQSIALVHTTPGTPASANVAELGDPSSGWHPVTTLFQHVALGPSFNAVQATAIPSAILPDDSFQRLAVMSEQKITVQSDPTSYILIERGQDFSLVDFHLHDSTTHTVAATPIAQINPPANSVDSDTAKILPAAQAAVDPVAAAPAVAGGMAKQGAAPEPVPNPAPTQDQAIVVPPPPHSTAQLSPITQHLIGTETVTLGSAPETLYFDGGNVTVVNFIVGTDKLLISNSVLANDPVTIVHDAAGDWIMHIGSAAMVTLIGIVNHS